jgi:serine/threonine protein phosphatase PrpC
MEKLLLGKGIKKKSSSAGSSSLCDFHMFVMKGHGECGDSAFAYCDDNQAIIAVFDGVSGEPGAAHASSLAAADVLESLKGKQPSEDNLKEALIHASRKILHGYTTATIISISKDGSFVMASVGDSPVYGLNSKSELDLEMNLGRPVGKGDSILKFMNFRSMVTSVLGPSEVDMEIRFNQGRISKGEVFIIASDCLCDNLFVKVADGYVTDASGSDDLQSIIGSLREPEKILKSIEDEILKRMQQGNVEKPGKMLSPKQDDLSIIVLRWL